MSEIIFSDGTSQICKRAEVVRKVPVEDVLRGDVIDGKTVAVVRHRRGIKVNGIWYPADSTISNKLVTELRIGDIEPDGKRITSLEEDYE